MRFPCVHAAATTPVQQMGVVLAQNHPSVSAFPDSTFGSACTSTFSRFAQRLLALRPAHSRSHQSRDRYPGASDISSPPCLPRLLPAGAVAGRGLHPLEKRRLVTAHVVSGHSSMPDQTARSRRFQTFARWRWSCLVRSKPDLRDNERGAEHVHNGKYSVSRNNVRLGPSVTPVANYAQANCHEDANIRCPGT